MIGNISLLSGWLPIAVQVAVAVAVGVVAGAGWRSRQWRSRWVPAVTATALGVVVAISTAVAFATSGWASEPPPTLVWVWVGTAAGVLALLVIRWPSARWGRRALGALTAPLCLLCAGLVLNMWVGYLPTVTDAYQQITGAPLPEQVATGTLPTRPTAPTDGSPAGTAGTPAPSTALPATGQVVAVTIPAAISGFTPRQQYLYLPPVWSAGPSSPRLPVIMMIGAEFSAATDWVRAGDAVATADAFARAHHGVAPILIFLDAAGRVGNDTECVNGPHGRVADYLTRDVRAWVSSQFGAPTDPRWWSVVGWSMGGTCAVDLAVTHPELFASFEDISGDLGPNTGTPAQTVTRLYGGNHDAWARFDPLTVLSGHPRYPDSAGIFDAALDSSGHGVDLDPARQLCAAAAHDAITCTVRGAPGRHTWQFAAHAFTAALPWLVDRSTHTGPIPPPR